METDTVRYYVNRMTSSYRQNAAVLQIIILFPPLSSLILFPTFRPYTKVINREQRTVSLTLKYFVLVQSRVA